MFDTGGFREPAEAGFSIATSVGEKPAGRNAVLDEERRSAEKALPASLTFPVANFSELELNIEPGDRALWCYMKPNGPPSFTPSMVRELNQLHARIRQYAQSAGGACPLDYYVMGSRLPSIYNMGGDLNYMIGAIRSKNREALRSYAHGCVHAVHAIWHGFDLPMISICIVEGDALGGGLEGVICFNTIIAERDAKMGMPEMLFGSFPGMGALSFLSRRIGMTAAERMIRGSQIYSAEQMHEMGLVDILVDKGEAANAARDYIRDGRRRYPVNLALEKAKRRVAPIEIGELLDITDLWVETALGLEEQDLRRMEILAKAQSRRLLKQ